MRTLKKALCLVLVLAMVFTLAVPALAVDAKDFTDYAEIENKEAVEVLTTLGVINGKDGGYDPTGSFTRAEAATMISYLTLGKTVADALPATSTQFSDVPTSFWGAKYIQYCANEGIITGYGDGTFGPNDTLTASQWALMLLGALGYEASNEGIGGAGWEIQVTKLAMTAGVADAEELTATFNRDMAAQFALNTLKADVVTYTGGSKVEINGATITTGANRSTVTNTAADDYRETGTDTTAQFCEVHFPDLALLNTTGTADAFGRPASTWKYDTKEIGVYASEPVKTYTTAVTGGQLYTDLGKPTVTEFKRIVNGQPTGDLSAKVVSGNKDSYGGNGTLIEIYKTAPGKYTAVAVQTFAGTITAHHDAVKDANGDISEANKEKVTVSVTTNGTTVTGDFKTTAFTQADATNGTLVLVTASTTDGSTYTIQSVKAAESKTVTATWRNDTSFVADGTTYKYSENKNATISAGEVTGKTAKVVYFDDYGYVIYVTEPSSATPNYAYVLDIDSTKELHGDPVFYAKLLYTDGTVESVKVTETDKTKAGKLVSYADGTGSNAGKVVLTKVADVGGGLTVNKNTADLIGAVVNNNTIFVVETTDSNGNSVYTSYTGVTNVPALTSTSSAGVANDEGVWTVIYALGAKLTGSATTSTDVVYVNGASKAAATDAVKGNYYTYNAVVNGTITTIEATVDTLDGMYGSLTKNEKGLVTSGSALTGTGIAAAETGDVTAVAKSGVIQINSKNCVYDDATVVYVVNADNTISASSIGAVKTTHDVVAGYTTNGILTLVVVK